MRRSVWVAVLIGTLLITGCSSPANHPLASKQKPELVVMTSFYPLYIMTLNVTAGISGIKVINLTTPQTGCLHDYQLKPSDVKNLAQAQVLITNGAGMESFLKRITAQYPELRMIEASAGADLIKDVKTGEVNPHLWVSINGAIQEVTNIKKGLKVMDPVHAEQYEANANQYISKLQSLQKEMVRELSKVSNRNIVTFHEAFPYFAREFNLNIVAVVEREPGSEPSAAELATTVEEVKRSGVKVLFAEPQYSTSAADVISRETGARVYLLDPGVTGADQKDAYLAAMRKNLAVLKEALQ